MFNQIIEQDRIKQQLEGAIRQGKVGHAYLFCGAKGMGKATLARSFAAALRCGNAPSEALNGALSDGAATENGLMKDFVHVGLQPKEHTIKIKQIRELKSIVAEKTFDEHLRICLITDADRMTTEAQNALLKTLEEPFPGNVFLLTSENKEGLLPTILSRCQIFQLEPVSDAGMKKALQINGLTLSEERQTELIADCGGNIGQLLAKCADDADEKIKDAAIALIYDIINGKPEGIFAFADQMGKLKQESAALAAALITTFEGVFKTCCSATPAYGAQINRLSAITDASLALQILEIFFEFSDAMQYNINLRLAWESALFKIYELTEKQT